MNQAVRYIKAQRLPAFIGIEADKNNLALLLLLLLLTEIFSIQYWMKSSFFSRTVSPEQAVPASISQIL